MHGPTWNVLGLFGAPDREKSINAVSLALLHVHSNHEGIGWDKIAEVLGYKTKDPVCDCRDGKSLIGFDAIARLAYFFPAEFGEYIEPLWHCRPPEQPTPDDLLDETQVLLDRLRKLVRKEEG